MPNDAMRAPAAARRAVALVFAFSIGLLLAILFERGTYYVDARGDVEAVRHTQALADRLLLLDERLTASAQLFASTGLPHWRARYNADLVRIYSAIGEAQMLATPDVAARFDTSTVVANDWLAATETTAMEMAAGGRLAEAQALLLSDAYSNNKIKLAEGTSDLLEDIRARAQAESAATQQRGWWILGVVALLYLSVFPVIWRRLARSLDLIEAGYRERQQEVTRLALHDALTGLPNRRHLDLQLDLAVERHRRDGQGFALALIDLDRFKPVNDRHGHAAGDAVLREISRRLLSCTRGDEVAVRLGGDEFVLLLQGVESPNTAGSILNRALSTLSAPITVGELELQMEASAGIAMFPQHAEDTVALMAAADAALYAAKGNRLNRLCFFDPSRLPADAPGRGAARG